MDKGILRLSFSCLVAASVGVAAAQNQSHGSNGGGSSSGGHVTSGGQTYSGGSGVRNTGGNGGYRGDYRQGGGTYNSRGQSSGSSYSHYGQGSYSRFQSQGGNAGYNGRTNYGGYSQNRGYSGYSQNRGYGGYASQSRTGYSGRSGGAISYSGNHGYTGQDLSRGHADLSRSGPVRYDSNNNKNGLGRDLQGESRIGAAPHGRIDRATLGNIIGNGNGNPGLYRGGWRTGYFGYGSGWRDSFFAFPFYCFDPWFAPCYVSPWWYYPCLPAYIAAPNVIIVDTYPSTNWTGSEYNWDPGTQGAPAAAPVPTGQGGDATGGAGGAGDDDHPAALTHNQVLDDSVQDLINAFEQDDQKAIDRVVPHSGNVNIYTDGKYSYSLKSNDFYDTYVDGIESTKTDRYEVLDVKEGKDGTSARVVAKHVYNDPWGNRTYVYHSYFLQKEGDQFVIREFGTSDYRTGF